MTNKKRTLAALIAALLAVTLVAGCSGSAAPTSSAQPAASPATQPQAGSSAEATPAASTDLPETDKLVLYASMTADVLESYVAYFEEQTGIDVELVEAGTGELIKRIESEGDTPLGDILFGGTADGNYIQKLELFEEYRSPNEEFMRPEYQNRTGKVTSVELVTSVLMVNTEQIGDIEVTGYASLLQPELKGRIAHADPTKASSAFEHMVNQLYAMGQGDPEKGWDYMGQFVTAMDGKMLSSSGAVFRGVADGEYPVGLTYEAIANSYKNNGAPVDIVYMEEGIITQPSAIAIIKNAPNMRNAQLFIDMLTGAEYQAIITQEPLYRRSPRTDIPDADGVVALDTLKRYEDDPEYVDANKQSILDRFKELQIG